MAESSRHAMYYDAESTFGTTETSPAFSYMRHTGTTLGTTKSAIVSEELNTHRGITDARHGNKTISGDINGELSYGSFNDLAEAAMGGTWSAEGLAVTASDISATASDNSINSVAGEFTQAVGDIIEVKGFTGTLTNNGVAVVLTASTSKLTLDGIDLVDETAGDSVTVTAMSKLTTGTTRRSFTMLRDFSDLTNGRYQLYTGCEVNSLAISIGLDSIISATIGVMGKGQYSSASEPSGSTFGDALETEPLTSHQGDLYENGEQNCMLTALDFTLENGLEAKHNICSDETDQHGIGRTNVTGNATAYFDDDVLLAKFLNETESSIMYSIEDSAGNKLAFWIPRVLYTGGQPDVGGEANTPISLSFQALHDATYINSTIAIAKLDA